MAQTAAQALFDIFNRPAHDVRRGSFRYPSFIGRGDQAVLRSAEPIVPPTTPQAPVVPTSAPAELRSVYANRALDGGGGDYTGYTAGEGGGATAAYGPMTPGGYTIPASDLFSEFLGQDQSLGQRAAGQALSFGMPPGAGNLIGGALDFTAGPNPQRDFSRIGAQAQREAEERLANADLLEQATIPGYEDQVPQEQLGFLPTLPDIPREQLGFLPSVVQEEAPRISAPRADDTTITGSVTDTVKDFGPGGFEGAGGPSPGGDYGKSEAGPGGGAKGEGGGGWSGGEGPGPSEATPGGSDPNAGGSAPGGDLSPTGGDPFGGSASGDAMAGAGYLAKGGFVKRGARPGDPRGPDDRWIAAQRGEFVVPRLDVRGIQRGDDGSAASVLRRIRAGSPPRRGKSASVKRAAPPSSRDGGKAVDVVRWVTAGPR